MPGGTPAHVEFWIHVRPRASRDAVGGEHGGDLCVHVRAAPSDGAANRAVCATLAAVLGLRPREVELVSGARGRRKRIRAVGPPERLHPELARLAGLTTPVPVP